MDLKTATASDVSGFWTNEKHVNFLNSMEASFVRRMLENDGRSVLVHDIRLPLDRYLPDSSESTRDLQNQRNRRKRASFSDVDDDVITEKNTRRRPSQPYDASEDQVVPQVENIKGEKGGVSGELEVAVVVATEEESCRKAK